MYKLSGATLLKTRIYISDTARLQSVTACGRISEPNTVAFTSFNSITSATQYQNTVGRKVQVECLAYLYSLERKLC